MEATLAQRRRSTALVVTMVALASLGAASRLSFPGSVPAPCGTPGVVDGVLVCDGAGAPAGARAWLAGHKLDVNVATAGELEAIPGVGPSMARAILQARAARGRFASFDDIDDIDGVGPKTLEKLRPYIEVR
jgi:competence protein ComEA